MKYFVTVGNEQHEVVLDGETVQIDGATVRAHVEDLPGTPVKLVTIGDQVHRVLERRGDERSQYDLSIGGYQFVVEALNERARVIRDLSRLSTKPAAPLHLIAPMPGMIVRVNVAAGDHVRAGQGLVVMEAMKMENELRAGTAGVVKRVVATPGSAVEKGALLLEMEA